MSKTAQPDKYCPSVDQKTAKKYSGFLTLNPPLYFIKLSPKPTS